MSLLSRVEGLFEGIIEGGARRIFRPQLQPIEITHALERVMVTEKTVGPSSVDVPNAYRAKLHPADFQRFASLRGVVEHDAAAYLELRAQEQDFRPIGPIQVELVSDPAVPRSFVRGEGVFDTEAGPAATRPIESTRRLAPVQARAPSRIMLLVSEDGRDLRVGQQPFKLGRAVDNDFVVRDARVSRYHAVIEPSADGWVVRDLESTNGTFVGGRRVEAMAIDAPAEISLGGYRLAPRSA